MDDLTLDFSEFGSDPLLAAKRPTRWTLSHRRTMALRRSAWCF